MQWKSEDTVNIGLCILYQIIKMSCVLPKDGDLLIYCIVERSEVGMLDTGN